MRQRYKKNEYRPKKKQKKCGRHQNTPSLRALRALRAGGAAATAVRGRIERGGVCRRRLQAASGGGIWRRLQAASAGGIWGRHLAASGGGIGWACALIGQCRFMGGGDIEGVV